MTPKKVLQFALGPIGGAILSVISLPIVAWLFSSDDVGRVSLLNVVLSFGTLFFTLGLDQSYVREFHESKNKALLFKMAILPGGILLLAILSVILLLGPWLAEIVFGQESTIVTWLLSIALLCSFLSRFLSLILRMNERGLAFSMSQLLPKAFVLVIILIYILFEIEKNFEQLLLAYTLAIVLACLIFTWNTRNEWFSSFYQKISLEQILPMFKFGLPLIFGGVAFWGVTSLDKILLSKWSSYSELAVYSMSVSFASVATIFQSVFSTVWAPTVYKWASVDDGHDKVINTTRYVLIILIILFCLFGLSSWLVAFLLPNEYSSVQWILVACLTYPLFYTLSETTVVGVGIARKSNYAMISCVLALIVNVVCNYFLVPLFGAAGAASSTCLTFWFFLVLRTEFSIYVWKSIPRLKMYLYTLIIISGAIFGAIFQEVGAPYIYLFWFFLLVYSLWDFRLDIVLIRKLLSKNYGLNI
ncbi:oligosaccharide flippase family protein [Shewanella algae]|uniref:lipopolysaccharide biosynthesis protein n=1 Tax=Shewanella algae TaxID=38313 RepID=UPI003AABA3D5